MKLALKKISKTKRLILISVGLLLVAAGGLFAYAEYASSQQVKTNDKAYSEARQAIYDQLSAEKLSIQSLTDVESIASRASQDLCKSSFIAQWRLSSDDQADCQTQQQQLQAVSDRASDISQRLIIEQAVAKMFDGVEEQLAKAKAGDYQAQKKLWSQASQDLAGISGEDVYQNHLDMHQSAVKQIIERYDGLIKADKAEKRSQFDDAATELQQAYEDLGNAKTDSQTTYREQSVALLDAVEQL